MVTLKTLNRILFVITLLPWLWFSFDNKLGFTVGVVLFVANWINIYQVTTILLRLHLVNKLRVKLSQQDTQLVRRVNTQRVCFSTLALIGVLLNVAIFNFGEGGSIADKVYMLLCGAVLCYYIDAISSTLRVFAYEVLE